MWYEVIVIGYQKMQKDEISDGYSRLNKDRVSCRSKWTYAVAGSRGKIKMWNRTIMCLQSLWWDLALITLNGHEMQWDEWLIRYSCCHFMFDINSLVSFINVFLEEH